MVGCWGDALVFIATSCLVAKVFHIVVLLQMSTVNVLFDALAPTLWLALSLSISLSHSLSRSHTK